jgi:aminoglycoside 6'-N-acetyltransferase
VDAAARRNRSWTFAGQEGNHVTNRVSDVGLRELDPQRDLQLLERWLRSPHVVQWWGTPEQQLPVMGQRSKDAHAIITADGRPVGYLCWQRPPREELEAAALTDLPVDLVDIDILIGEPEYLGCGVGPKALGLLLARLRSEGVGFAGVGTSSANHAAIRAYEKAGFRFFRAFDDPDFGACRYMLARLRGAVEPPVAGDGAAGAAEPPR